MVYSVRFNEQEQTIVEQYAKLHNMTISELLRKSVMEAIEDEIDITICRKALQEFKNNPKTYTHEEIGKELRFL
ncbi:MAG: CopG family transcriptional regulator [Thermoplasmata archaeon]|nr:CopG family transcriptional regulator [Thermoplasmata archaeon]